MTGPASGTDGSKKSPTVGNRLKQHHIYRVISARRSRPFPPSDWDLGRKSPLDLRPVIWERFHSESGGEETKRGAIS